MVAIFGSNYAYAGTPHRTGCGSRVIKEYFATGAVGEYSTGCYSEALRSLDADARLYSGAVNAILAARFRASSGGSKSSSSGDSGGDSTVGNAPVSGGGTETEGLVTGDSAPQHASSIAAENAAPTPLLSQSYAALALGAGMLAALAGIVATLIARSRR